MKEEDPCKQAGLKRVRLEKRPAGMHSRTAAWHGCLARGIAAVRDDSWASTASHVDAGIMSERDTCQGACPTSARNVCVVTYLAYHVLTAEHAGIQARRKC